MNKRVVLPFLWLNVEVAETAPKQDRTTHVAPSEREKNNVHVWYLISWALPWRRTMPGVGKKSSQRLIWRNVLKAPIIFACRKNLRVLWNQTTWWTTPASALEDTRPLNERRSGYQAPVYRAVRDNSWDFIILPSSLNAYYDVHVEHSRLLLVYGDSESCLLAHLKRSFSCESKYIVKTWRITYV